MNQSQNSISKESISGIDKNNRFAKLYEKINHIQNSEVQNVSANKFTKLEHKIHEVEENFNANIEALDLKYSLLKDQITKFTKIIEDEKASKEKFKSKNHEEVKNLENKIKAMFTEERENTKVYLEEYFKKIDTGIQNFEKNCKSENEVINNNLNAMKEFMEVSLFFNF